MFDVPGTNIFGASCRSPLSIYERNQYSTAAITVPRYGPRIYESASTSFHPEEETCKSFKFEMVMSIFIEHSERQKYPLRDEILDADEFRIIFV